MAEESSDSKSDFLNPLQDDLGAFLLNMREQQLVSIIYKTEEFYLPLHKMHGYFTFLLEAFGTVEKSLKMSLVKDQDLLPSLLLMRAHSIFRAACGLVLSGQSIEAYILMRAMLEWAAASVLVFQKPSLAELFLNRHINECFHRETRTTFSAEKFKEAISGINTDLGRLFSDLCKVCIDHGAHPTEMAVSGATTEEENPDGTRVFHVHYSCPGTDLHKKSLVHITQAGGCALKIAQYLFSGLCMRPDIDQSLRDSFAPLLEEIDQLFKVMMECEYGPPLQTLTSPSSAI